MQPALLAPPTLLEALDRAGVTHGDFASALAIGMSIRGRFTTSAPVRSPLSAVQLAALPPMSASLNGSFVDVDMRLGDTCTANLRERVSRLVVEGCDLPGTLATAYRGGPLSALVSHPLLSRPTPIVGTIEQRTRTELRVAFHEEPVPFP